MPWLWRWGRHIQSLEQGAAIFLICLPAPLGGQWRHADTNNPLHNHPHTHTHLFISHKTHMLENLVGCCCMLQYNYVRLASLLYNGLMSLDTCHRIPLAQSSSVLQRLQYWLKCWLRNNSSIFQKEDVRPHFLGLIPQTLETFSVCVLLWVTFKSWSFIITVLFFSRSKDI